ncbi:unannotated protein [freshwater metagenome]|uniref:Unannotated protein n=1 Tax=freshwater metagenome TaxID=449393 RepID=A0A6J7KTE2_9ZZZZ
MTFGTHRNKQTQRATPSHRCPILIIREITTNRPRHPNTRRLHRNLIGLGTGTSTVHRSKLDVVGSPIGQSSNPNRRRRTRRSISPRTTIIDRVLILRDCAAIVRARRKHDIRRTIIRNRVQRSWSIRCGRYWGQSAGHHLMRTTPRDGNEQPVAVTHPVPRVGLSSALGSPAHTIRRRHHPMSSRLGDCDKQTVSGGHRNPIVRLSSVARSPGHTINRGHHLIEPLVGDCNEQPVARGH